jgi:hypothetical protein
MVKLAAILATIVIVLAVGAVTTSTGRMLAAAIQHFMLYYSGVFALIGLTTSVGVGLVSTDRIVMTPGHRVMMQSVHRAVSFGTVAFLVIHILLEILAQRAHVVDAFIPFLSPYRTFYMGLGAIASDLIVLLIVTGIIRRRFVNAGQSRMWRWIHYSSYVMFVAGVLHGLLAGRYGKPYVDWSYGFAIAFTAGGIVIRYIATSLRPRESLSMPPASERPDTGSLQVRAAALGMAQARLTGPMPMMSMSAQVTGTGPMALAPGYMGEASRPQPRQALAAPVPGGYDGGYDAPGYGAPGYDSPGYDAQGYEAQGYEAQGYEAQGYETPGYNAQGYESPGYDSPAPRYEPGYDGPPRFEGAPRRDTGAMRQIPPAPAYGTDPMRQAAPGYAEPGYGTRAAGTGPTRQMRSPYDSGPMRAAPGRDTGAMRAVPGREPGPGYDSPAYGNPAYDAGAPRQAPPPYGSGPMRQAPSGPMRQAPPRREAPPAYDPASRYDSQPPRYDDRYGEPSEPGYSGQSGYEDPAYRQDYGQQPRYRDPRGTGPQRGGGTGPQRRPDLGRQERGRPDVEDYPEYYTGQMNRVPSYGGDERR